MKSRKAKRLYQVAYEGQLITEPLDYQVAAQIAADENLDAFSKGHYPLAEVVLAGHQGVHQ